MTKDEALKLALEALRNAYWPTESDLMPAHNIKECAEALTAIKEALAEPEQEPVAWISATELLVMRGNALGGAKDWRVNLGLEPEEGDLGLYTTPPQGIYYIPPQRTWVGLTEDEILSISADCASSHQHMDIQFAKAIEAALKAKNT